MIYTIHFLAALFMPKWKQYTCQNAPSRQWACSYEMMLFKSTNDHNRSMRIGRETFGNVCKESLKHLLSSFKMLGSRVPKGSKNFKILG